MRLDHFQEKLTKLEQADSGATPQIINEIASDIGNELPRNRQELISEVRAELARFVDTLSNEHPQAEYVRGACSGIAYLCSAFVTAVQENKNRMLMRRIAQRLCVKHKNLFIEILEDLAREMYISSPFACTHCRRVIHEEIERGTSHLSFEENE
ncbi:MAG: hypothetical protein KGI50_01305 [Patescibacteria group bacterium]|nr:hypothetical protein [Patescibacteria group bacterium]MDE2438013.1 hypothetical protein [Patescibacteria group bacterium]